jgi:para-nitrobenzyl esterase
MHELIARTGQGRVRGTQVGEVGRFRGIPYAAAPFGDRRFMSPAKATGWDGVRDALEFGPTAPAAPLPAVFMPDVSVDGEECLNLNVWTPDPTGSGLPVMVWLHGGGNVSGSSAQPIFDGASFASSGVVFVSLNFRIGAEGWALLPDTVANRTLLDQIAALEWVQDNIAAFGGDPGNVTVFGTSAGAGATLALLSMRTGLFRRAIVQSAAASAAIAAQDARLVTAEIARMAGVSPTLAGFSTIDAQHLAELSTRAFLDVSTTPDEQRWGSTTVAAAMPFGPVIDGDILAGHPFELLLAGGPEELMIGSNSDELLAMIAARVAPRPPEEIAAQLTDFVFRQPLLQIAKTRPLPTFVYEFAWPSPLPGVGAAHGIELGFVFGNLGISALEGQAPSWDLADKVQAAWVAFATNGNPGWPAHTLDNNSIRTFR